MVLRQGRPISTYPTVVNAARMWKQTGWEVDIITQADPDVPNLFLRFIPFTNPEFVLQMWQLVRHVCAYRHAVVIAYEPIDAELCAPLPLLHQARYIYHNIELRYSDNRSYVIHNALERFFYQRCDTVICQDPLRMGELKKLLGNPKAGAQEFEVPNTYMKENVPRENRYWHRTFDLSEDGKVLLYTGAIQRRKLGNNVIKHIIKVLPANWSLALWGWSVEGYADELRVEFEKQVLEKKLLIATEIMPEEYYAMAVASATAGLVWYSTTENEDRNEYNMGLSSGKFWRFVTLRRKVLVLDKPGLGNYVNSNNLGVVVKSLSDVTEKSISALGDFSLMCDKSFYEDYYSQIF